jgi:hypothetical protein
LLAAVLGILAVVGYGSVLPGETRFEFRSPDLTVAAIQAAMTVPEAKRVQAILTAAASGFRIRGLVEELHTLRKAASDETPTS